MMYPLYFYYKKVSLDIPLIFYTCLYVGISLDFKSMRTIRGEIFRHIISQENVFKLH